MKVKARQKLHRLQAHVAESLWAILPSKLQEIVAVLQAYDEGMVRAAINPRRPAAIAPPQGGNIAIMNLFGTISKRQNWITSESGGTSADVFASNFKKAMADDSIAGVLVVIDSPGGMVAGTPELADVIRSHRDTKPAWGFVDPMAASAAYWIGAQFGQLIAAPSAETIGSIGVYRVHQDESAMQAKLGIKTTVIRSVEAKAEGNPWEPLSDDARGRMQAKIDETHQQFVAAVATGRGLSASVVSDRFGRGSTYMAREALDRKMVDRIATIETVLSELSAKVGTASSVSVLADLSFDRGASMHAKVRLALVQMGLCSYADTQATADAALAGLFAAHGKQVPQDHDECEKQIRALAAPTAATPAPAAPAAAATLLAAPAAAAPAGAQRPACDYLSVSSLHAVLATAGASLSDTDKFAVQGELIAAMNANGGQLATSVVLDKINQRAIAANPPAGANVRIEAGEAQLDKFRDEATAAFCLAGTPGMAGKFVNPRTGDEQDFKRPKGVKNSALAIARECMVLHGVPAHQVMHASADEVAMLVMAGGHTSRRMAEDLFGRQMAADWGNVTGMYLNLLMDAGNIQLRKAYTEVDTTYQVWAVRIEDFQRYETKNLVTVGVFPDPTAIGEDGEFDEVGTVDGKETLTIHEWGEKFTYSYKLAQNDILGGLIGRHAQKMASAMRRKENRLVYSVLKDNRTLSDTGALFNGTAISSAGGHNNLTTGSIAADGYSAALNTMTQKMGAMTAPGAGSAPLNLKAKYVLHPPALRLSFWELLKSPTKVGQSNPGIPNPWNSGMQPVEDAELATQFGGLDTSFYVLGDGNVCEHVVYARMSGQSGPVFNVFEKPGVLGYGATIHQAFAAGAVDYRNAQKHVGA